MRSSDTKWVATFAAAILAIPALVIAMALGVGFSQSAGASTGGACITGPGKLPSAVPQPLNSIFTAAAEQYDVPPYVVALLYYGENGSYREPPPPYGKGEAYRSSPVGAQGPMQFMPGTWSTYKNSNPARAPGNVQDLTDAAFAAAHYAKAELGAKQGMPFGTLADFTKSGTALRVFANYNAGPYSTNYRNSQTIDYVTRINAEYQKHYLGFSTGALAPTFQSNDCGETVAIPVTSKTNGYANTASLKCLAGTDAGVVKTAKGNAIRLCNVGGGFVVNASISQRVARLLAYAAADGVTLHGSAFRTPDKQIALRKQHCGYSHYAIYEMPSMQCSPPTAIPGSSKHEQGEALDVSGVGGYGTRVFVTIKKYAVKPDVRLYNTVPTEYWHWDVGNG
jgi:hypothetical protein